MFRLLLLLCGGLFLTLLVGGQDRGQVRFGLMNLPEPAQVAISGAETMLPPAATASPTVPATPVMPVMPVAFAAAPPAAAPAPLPAARPAPDLRPADASASEPRPPRVMWVTPNSVNVRGGPSTDDVVVGRLTRNEAVLVVAEVADGWLQVRVEGDGIEGFVAARLLTDRAP